MELLLRKQTAANIYNKQSFTQSLKRRKSLINVCYSCSVTYEIVSNIPKVTEEIEDWETLALLAARSENEGTLDEETYIEKYTQGVLAARREHPESGAAPPGCQGERSALQRSTFRERRHIQRSLSTPNVYNISSSPPDLSGFNEDDKGWPENQLDVSVYSFSCYGTLPRDSPHRSKEGCPSENPHTLTVSPFKAFSPQPPKFFKPLMPVKEEHKKRRALEARPLLSQESMPPSQAHKPGCIVPPGSNGSSVPVEHNSKPKKKIDSKEEENELEALSRKLLHAQPYVPMESADFNVYNASLEKRKWSSSKVDLTDSRALENAVSRSPTIAASPVATSPTVPPMPLCLTWQSLPATAQTS